MTSKNIEINQKSSIGSGNTQIGVQNNTGLSVSDAMEIAFSIFHEYYPQLKQEALADVERLVKENLQHIPAENIVSPTPRIVVPTLQNASITSEKGIREFYANLLANSMNKATKDNVHPGFVEIIKQLCLDESKILWYLGLRNVIPTITLRSVTNDSGVWSDVICYFSDIGESKRCERPYDISKYFDNFVRLGLAEKSQLSTLADKREYEELKSHPYIQTLSEKTVKEYPDSHLEFVENYIMISSYGKSFCETCIDYEHPMRI